MYQAPIKDTRLGIFVYLGIKRYGIFLVLNVPYPPFSPVLVKKKKTRFQCLIRVKYKKEPHL